MIRNESTGKFESAKKSYKVYSELLNKPFDTVEELEAAEAEVRKAEEAKLNAANVKKADAEVVKTAITKRVEAEVDASKAKKEAYENYLETLDEINNGVKAAKKAESDALKTFCEKYGSFHDTITVGDVTYTCNYSTDEVSYVDPIKKLLNSIWF